MAIGKREMKLSDDLASRDEVEIEMVLEIEQSRIRIEAAAGQRHWQMKILQGRDNLNRQFHILEN